MKKLRNLMIVFLLILGSILVTLGLLYNYYSSSVSNNTENKEVVIESGSSSVEIGRILKENNIIKSELFFKIYLRLYNINDLKAGTYLLNEAMDLNEILSDIQEGSSYNPNEISITFKEGINMRELAKIIEENTNNSYDEVMSLVKNKEYLEGLISKYWFITDDILNNKIYYSLEGYLFPETYRFSSEDVTVEEIFNKLIDQMASVLDLYRDSINNSKFDIHEILTLASVIEKEGKVDDFGNISSVFHNRLDANKKLESCATTFYGMKLDFNETGIANSKMIANNNPYNTYKIASLPVGPISSISKKAIEASLEPNDNEYLYFLSDSSGKSYFFKTYKEHQKKQKELQAEGKWDR